MNEAQNIQNNPDEVTALLGALAARLDRETYPGRAWPARRRRGRRRLLFVAGASAAAAVVLVVTALEWMAPNAVSTPAPVGAQVTVESVSAPRPSARPVVVDIALAARVRSLPVPSFGMPAVRPPDDLGRMDEPAGRFPGSTPDSWHIPRLSF